MAARATCGCCARMAACARWLRGPPRRRHARPRGRAPERWPPKHGTRRALCVPSCHGSPAEPQAAFSTPAAAPPRCARLPELGRHAGGGRHQVRDVLEEVRAVVAPCRADLRGQLVALAQVQHAGEADLAALQGLQLVLSVGHLRRPQLQLLRANWRSAAAACGLCSCADERTPCDAPPRRLAATTA